VVIPAGDSCDLLHVDVIPASNSLAHLLVERVDDDEEPASDDDVDREADTPVGGGVALEDGEDDDEGHDVPHDSHGLDDEPREQQALVFLADAMDEDAQGDHLNDEYNLSEGHHELDDTDVETDDALSGFNMFIQEGVWLWPAMHPNDISRLVLAVVAQDEDNVHNEEPSQWGDDVPNQMKDGQHLGYHIKWSTFDTGIF